MRVHTVIAYTSSTSHCMTGETAAGSQFQLDVGLNIESLFSIRCNELYINLYVGRYWKAIDQTSQYMTVIIQI